MSMYSFDQILPIERCIDSLYWVSDRSEHSSDWNKHIFDVLSLVDEDDYE